MKIRMLASFAGPDFTVDANEETEHFSDAESVRMIAAGFAVPVAEKKIERAVKTVPEKRVK